MDMRRFVGRDQQFLCIYTNQLTGLAAGDIIEVDVTSVSQTDQWPCVWLSYADASWNWFNFDETEPRQAMLDKTSAMPYTAQLVLSQTMVDLILAGQSLNVTGSGYRARPSDGRTTSRMPNRAISTRCRYGAATRSSASGTSS